MEMPGRKWQASNYRYSHNGQEKESELFAGANSAEYWMYDSRLGRRWELDPLAYPWQSPYVVFNNGPIEFSDPLGLEGEDPIFGGNLPEMGVTIKGDNFMQKVANFFIKTAAKVYEIRKRTDEAAEQASVFSMYAVLTHLNNMALNPNPMKTNGLGKYSQAADLGKLTGNVYSMFEGGSEIIAGGGGEVLGFSLDATGVGSAAGIPVNVASAALIAHGVTLIGVTTHNMLQDRVDNVDGETMGSSKDGGDDSNFEKMKNGNNKKKNEEVTSLYKKYKLNKDQQREIHDIITGQGYSRKEIEQIIIDHFGTN